MSTYLAIDLKSFYASVECVTRGLDPLTTNLVVADASRTEKTICLAVTPSLKAHGIPGRARLFEVFQRVHDVNEARRWRQNGKSLREPTYDAKVLAADEGREVSFITAAPRMALYMDYSTRIYEIYMRFVAPEDMHVYSVDEVFLDVTNYLKTYRTTARELCARIMREVLRETGITATAGIAPNLFLCKVAMDIVAKHIPPDADGARIAELDEMTYRRTLWAHEPLTDFWRVGPGYAKRLADYGMRTMGDIARCSLTNEDLLYRLFGVNAGLLIDHAWGVEPCTIADIHAYRPKDSSHGTGQVLSTPYSHDKARLIVWEMADALALDLVEHRLVTDQIVLTIGYDREGVTRSYQGEVATDRYGRTVPKPAHGSQNLGRFTASGRQITEVALALFERITDASLPVRRLTITANHTRREKDAPVVEMDLFADTRTEKEESREKTVQQTVLAIKERFGKNAVFKGVHLEEGGTALMRNKQIGGHRA